MRRGMLLGALGVGLALQVGCDDYLMPGPEQAGDAVPDRIMSRLNRTEYDRTVRDLFGTSLQPARDFPADDFGYGFDNIAATLSVSPLHVEMYSNAAHQLVSELYGELTLSPSVWRIEAEAADGGGAVDATGRVLFGGDAVSTRLYLPTDGSYVVAALAKSLHGTPATTALMVDGVELVQAPIGAEQRLEATVDLAAGHHTISAHYLDAETADDDEDLVVDAMEVSGPFDVLAPPPALADQVLSCVPGEPRDDGVWSEPDCVEHIVATFGRRAWRRPLSPAELDEQLSVYGAARAAGGDFDDGVGAALEALLVSPYFVYRVEHDPVGDGSARVDGYAMASRLSYFLWSSMPDDRLLDLAAAGMLQDDDVLMAEVDRMLDDPRAVSLVENLGGQWLGLRKIEEAAPDPDRFPEVDAPLVRAMEAELHELVRSVFLGDVPVNGLLTSTDAVLQPRLAAFYGVPHSEGPVRLDDRPGLLSRAGWLMSTSHPTRTSPVKRGAWVLDKVLCTPPPPAPAGVPELEEEGGASVLEQLAQHRADPGCAACHNAMDPIGIGLESFDAIGRARTTYDDGQPVEVAGELEGGGAFATTPELLQQLASDPRFESCAVQQTFTYAMARPPTAADQELVETLRTELVQTQSFRGLVGSLVLSRPFRERQAGGSP